MAKSFHKKHENLMNIVRTHNLTYEQARLGLQFITLTRWGGCLTQEGQLLHTYRVARRWSPKWDERRVSTGDVINNIPTQTLRDAGEYLASTNLREHWAQKYA